MGDWGAFSFSQRFRTLLECSASHVLILLSNCTALHETSCECKTAGSQLRICFLAGTKCSREEELLRQVLLGLGLKDEEVSNLDKDDNVVVDW